MVHPIFAVKINRNDMLKIKIIEVAAGNMAKFGIRECRMDLIASSIHVSKKTIYELFGSKQNLLYECVCFWINRFKEQIQQADLGSKSPLVAIVVLNNLALQQALNCSPSFHNDIKNRIELLTLFEQKYVAAINDSYEQQFIRSIQMGLFQKDINIHHTLNFFEQQIQDMYKQTYADALSKIDNYTFNIMTYLSGICTDKGREELAGIAPKQFLS